MAAFGKTGTFGELQAFVSDVYRQPNDRWFDLTDMSINVSRFTMRAVKAVRRDEIDRIEKNLAVALSWLTSTANRLHLDLDDTIWARFPYRCATCGACPCGCGENTNTNTARTSREPVRPQSIGDVQIMFAEIYPPQGRTIESGAIHLAEEVGEYQEAVLMYRTRHRAADLAQLEIELADYISCALGVYTSVEHGTSNPRGAAAALAELFADNCHECHNAPCDCAFDKVLDYNLSDRF